MTNTVVTGKASSLLGASDTCLGNHPTSRRKHAAQTTKVQANSKSSDLEGIVAKHATAPYLSYHAISTWYKIKNARYSQMAGRHELTILPDGLNTQYQ